MLLYSDMKVKIWDKERRLFIAYVEIPHIHAISMNESTENIIKGDNNFFLSICSRLRDVHKKIIYQDDIVIIQDNIWGKWESIVYTNPQTDKFYVESHPMLSSEMIELTSENIFKHNIRKIGNIFENPDLIKNSNFPLN